MKSQFMGLVFQRGQFLFEKKLGNQGLENISHTGKF